MTRLTTLTIVGCIFASLAFATHASAASVTELDLRARIEAATKGFNDLTATVTVCEKNKAALTKVDDSYARLYDFQSALLQLKIPDKIRIDSKLGMVKFEYIIARGKKIFRAPKVKVNKVDDFSNDPAKLQSPLDLGILTPQLWFGRRVEVVDDPEAQTNGEIKIKLTWFKGDMVNLAWIDATNLWLKRFEKRDSRNNLLARVVYSNPQNAGGVIWLPTKVELYAPDGAKAGSTELTDIKVNTGLPDSLFN
jgi:outer membrane lipoprotein-sorting protein